jgi:hypothetical protein
VIYLLIQDTDFGRLHSVLGPLRLLPLLENLLCVNVDTTYLFRGSQSLRILFLLDSSFLIGNNAAKRCELSAGRVGGRNDVRLA